MANLVKNRENSNRQAAKKWGCVKIQILAQFLFFKHKVPTFPSRDFAIT